MSYAKVSASLGFAGSLSGALTSAVSANYSAKFSKAQLDNQARLADINARIAELGAQSALMQGHQQVGALTLNAGRLKSQQRATLAANGVDLGFGNAAEIQASTDLMKEIDASTLTANAVRTAWGYRIQATNYQNDALTKRATASAISPNKSAISSLLGDAGNVAESWYSLSKSGALKGTLFEG